MVTKTEFITKHNQCIMTEFKRSTLSKLLDKITNTKRDVYGYRIYPNDVMHKLVVEYLETTKNEIDLDTLAMHLNIHWLRLKSVIYTQKLISTPVGIRMHHESLIPGWTLVFKNSKKYFRRSNQTA